MIPTPLPKGVTGYNFPPYQLSFTDFKASCTKAAEALQGTANSFRDADETHNYYQGVITVPGRTQPVSVICNMYYPIIAFATPPQEGECLLDFANCPELAQLLSNEFTVITAQESCAPLSSELLTELGPAERKMINLLEPERVGDVIFNWWD